MKTLLPLYLVFASLTPARGEVSVDVTFGDVKGDAVYVADLSVNDTAYIYSNFCHEDGKLFVPDTVRLQDFTKENYDATGVLYQIKVLPGRTLAVLIVDARQTQLAARGNPGAPAVLTKIEFKDAVIENLKGLFVPFFDPSSCAQQREWSVLTPLNFFTVDSINGHNSLSELIKSLE